MNNLESKLPNPQKYYNTSENPKIKTSIYIEFLQEVIRQE